jgi:uncharacterized protein with GYD domain
VAPDGRPRHLLDIDPAGATMGRQVETRPRLSEGGSTVAKYLYHGSYTQAGIKGVLKDGGTGRRKAVDALAKSLGGSVESMYWAFGSDDFFVIAELPSAAAAASLAATTGASGAVSISTVVLLTAKDIDAAVKLHPDYRAPGAK